MSGGNIQKHIAAADANVSVRRAPPTGQGAAR